MKKILNFIFNRITGVGLLLILQVSIIVWAIWQLSQYYIFVYVFCVVISVLAVIYLVNKKENPEYKLTWTLMIMLFQPFGGPLYLILEYFKCHRKFIKQLAKINQKTACYLKQDEKVIQKLEYYSLEALSQVKYIVNYAPIYERTMTQYLSPGEKFFEVLVASLKQAKHFIFLEYFIIHEGKMWDTVLNILEEKVKEGVEVRLLYDDIGSLMTVPYRYNEKLERKGIQCHVFNPLEPTLNIVLNNRDHRKITIIDGYIGFTGGSNLADEYINAVERFGYWKDAMILLKGEAVWNLTVMFLQTWDCVTHRSESFDPYSPYYYHKTVFESDGFVQPYGDSPLDQEMVSENVYLNLLYKAKKYVYICTPYLIVDDKMITAFTIAAKSGVKIKIITPHKADKWYVHMLTRSYYEELIQIGVEIYEYTPGFIHSKTFVCDDEVGIVGSINMDYRSLYLHFECGVWLYRTSSIMEIKKDFEGTLAVSERIPLESCQNVRIGIRIMRSILRLLAPLM